MRSWFKTLSPVRLRRWVTGALGRLRVSLSECIIPMRVVGPQTHAGHLPATSLGTWSLAHGASHRHLGPSPRQRLALRSEAWPSVFPRALVQD